MKPIFDYANVYLDEASEYDISKVNERSYLEQLFLQLRETLKERFEEYSFYILFSHKSDVIPVSSKDPKSNKVLFWFSDESGAFPQHLVNHYFLIFKSYVFEEKLNVYSNPLGYVNEFEEEKNKQQNKDINVFFSGNLNANRIHLYTTLFFRKYTWLGLLKLLPKPVLLKVVRRLGLKFNNLSTKKSVFLFSNGFKSGLNYKTYYNYILRSHFVLCPKGFHSNETFRHIESLHGGSIVISEKMPEVSIYQGNPFLIYKDQKGLDEILTRID